MRPSSKTSPRLSVVVPTLGSTPLLLRCLRALREDAGEEARILVVDQGPEAVSLPADAADEVLRPGLNLGFAGGMNLGLAACDTDYLAAVNDDLVVQPGWTAALLEALDTDPRAAAGQGMNFRLGAPDQVDGAGFAFNRWWQAVQRGHGEPLSEWMEGRPVEEIFGVSATAAVYRRSALEEVALPGGKVFDEDLRSYYEDVDLACRLRGAGFPSLLVRRAQAGHAGSATGRSLGHRRLELIYGNRRAVVARFLGSAFADQRSILRERDLRDLLRAVAGLRLGTALGIVAGMRRGRRLLPRYLHGEDGSSGLAAARCFPVEAQTPVPPEEMVR